MTNWDYIIVGGGSAGCVLASRLSEKPFNRVLLIEAGVDWPPGKEPENIRDTFYTAAYVKSNLWSDTRVHWLSDESNQPPTRAVFYEQARVMGGGSSVNSMIALRGHSLDFEEWTKLGVKGWTWADVEPFYRRLENDLDFDNDEHNQSGPIPVRRHGRREWPKFVRAVCEELETRGYRYIDDVNAGERDGFGRVPMSSVPEHRVSSAMGYLNHAVRRRPNLTILGSTLVTGLLMRGTRCSGVTASVGGQEISYRSREVCLCAGSFRSPAILMRAGIGPAEHLKALGIAIKVGLDGVGKNLHDHPTFAAAAHLRLGATQPRALRSHANAGLFYSSGVADCPTLDMYMPITNKVSWHPVGERIGGLFMVLMKPFSRGGVQLKSTDPNDFPQVNVNAFDDERDQLRAMLSMQFASDLLLAPEVKALTTYRFGGSFSERVSALNNYNRVNYLKSSVGAWLLDGPPVLRDWLMRTVVAPTAQLESLVANKAELQSWLRANVTGFFHPVGTCRMGAHDDPGAVVDEFGRVLGAQGLRVADASIMPSIVRATTNLTAIMIGEKIAQGVLDGR